MIHDTPHTHTHTHTHQHAPTHTHTYTHTHTHTHTQRQPSGYHAYWHYYWGGEGQSHSHGHHTSHPHCIVSNPDTHVAHGHASAHTHPMAHQVDDGYSSSAWDHLPASNYHTAALETALSHGSLASADATHMVGRGGGLGGQMSAGGSVIYEPLPPQTSLGVCACVCLSVCARVQVHRYACTCACEWMG